MTHWLMAFLLLASFPVAGANLALDPTKSRVGFTYQQMGSSVEGEFKRYTANVQFDPAHPEAGHVVFRIYPAGTDAGNADANNELLLPAFFDVRRFPEAMFESTRIQALANGRYDVTGKLTLKGVTRPMSTTAKVCRVDEEERIVFDSERCPREGPAPSRASQSLRRLR